MAQSPLVVSIEPSVAATGVSTTTSVKLDFSQSINNTTLAGLRILSPGGFVVPALVDTDATQGTATLKPLVALDPTTIYTVDVTSKTFGVNGEQVMPFTSSFTTGASAPGGVGSEYRLSTTSLGNRPSVSSVAFGPDGHLYASDGIDSIWRYPLNATTGLLDGTPERIYQQADMQTVGITFAPSATAEHLVLYTSHANRDNGGDLFTGTVSKLEIPSLGAGGSTQRTDVITGLPHPEALNHQPNGITFGPDGKLYHSIGGLATLGGSANWGASETLLSAAVLVADVENDTAFSSTVDVDTSAGYDPYAVDAPVTIFATGLRNAYDLAWHSNGQLYSGINANSLNGVTTPDDPSQAGNQAVGARKHEMLALVKEGLYYGHPNPTREEYILNGGNPTAGNDGVWEVGEYSVGVEPEPNFAGLPSTPAADGSPSGNLGIIYDTRASGGNSPNGLTEYTGPGALNGELLVSYFSGSRTVQTFELNPSTGLVESTRPLENPAGQPLSLTGPLDVTVDSASGRIYVADFGLQSDFGQAGRIVMLDPLSIGVEGTPPTASFASEATGTGRSFSFDGSSSTDNGEIAQYVWHFGDGRSALGVNPTHTFPRDGKYQATLTVVDDDGLATATSMSLTIGEVPEALLVVNSLTLTPAEIAIQRRIESLGFDVAVTTATSSSSGDASNKEVVVISSSVASTQVNTKFRDVEAGVVTWESFLFDDMNFTGTVQDSSYGFTTETYDMVNVDGESFLAGDLAGEILFSDDQQVFWGVPGADAKVVATLQDDPTRAVMFAYEAGDQLFNGSTAAGNRVGMFLFNDTAATLTSDGWTLFDNAILFAGGLALPVDGDFDFDGDVDGADFLAWQRGESPYPRSQNDLSLWKKASFQESQSALLAVPEPATGGLLLLAWIATWQCPRRKCRDDSKSRDTKENRRCRQD